MVHRDDDKLLMSVRDRDKGAEQSCRVVAAVGYLLSVGVQVKISLFDLEQVTRQTI